MLQLLSHPPATDVRSVRSSPSTCTRSAHQKPVVFRLGQDDFGLSPPTAAQRMFCRKLVAGFVVEPPPSMINLRKRIERRRRKKSNWIWGGKKWLGDLARAVLFNGRTSIVADRAWQTGLLVKVRQFCGSRVFWTLRYDSGNEQIDSILLNCHSRAEHWQVQVYRSIMCLDCLRADYCLR